MIDVCDATSAAFVTGGSRKRFELAETDTEDLSCLLPEPNTRVLSNDNLEVRDHNPRERDVDEMLRKAEFTVYCHIHRFRSPQDAVTVSAFERLPARLSALRSFERLFQIRRNEFTNDNFSRIQSIIYQSIRSRVATPIGVCSTSMNQARQCYRTLWKLRLHSTYHCQCHDHFTLCGCFNCSMFLLLMTTYKHATYIVFATTWCTNGADLIRDMTSMWRS